MKYILILLIVLTGCSEKRKAQDSLRPIVKYQIFLNETMLEESKLLDQYADQMDTVRALRHRHRLDSFKHISDSLEVVSDSLHKIIDAK